MKKKTKKRWGSVFFSVLCFFFFMIIFSLRVQSDLIIGEENTDGLNIIIPEAPAVSGGGGSGDANVSSVTAADSSLTITPTTGNVTAKINLANSNIWTANQYILGGGTPSLFVNHTSGIQTRVSSTSTSALIGTSTPHNLNLITGGSSNLIINVSHGGTGLGISPAYRLHINTGDVFLVNGKIFWGSENASIFSPTQGNITINSTTLRITSLPNCITIKSDINGVVSCGTGISAGGNVTSVNPGNNYILVSPSVGDVLVFLNDSALNSTIDLKTNNKFLNLSGTNANQNINIGLFNLTATWFKGLFDWTIGSSSTDYLTFNGSTLNFNETILNNTIERMITTEGHYSNVCFDKSRSSVDAFFLLEGYLCNTDRCFAAPFSGQIISMTYSYAGSSITSNGTATTSVRVNGVGTALNSTLFVNSSATQMGDVKLISRYKINFSQFDQISMYTDFINGSYQLAVRLSGIGSINQN